MKFIVLACIMMCTGCMTTQLNVVATYPWEGHYMSVKEARSALDGATLEKNESIWIISNITLKRVIDNLEKDK